MAIRVRPGISKTRLMSRTSIVRKPEWDQIRGNHQGQWLTSCINRPDTRLYLTCACRNFKKYLQRRSHPHRTVWPTLYSTNVTMVSRDFRTFGIGNSQSPVASRYPKGKRTTERSPRSFKPRMSSTAAGSNPSIGVLSTSCSAASKP